MCDLPKRQYLQHEIPAWVYDQSSHPSFFITINCNQRGTNQLATNHIWQAMLESVTHRQRQGLWHCRLFLVMPDHIHAILRFEGDKRMPLVIRAWKRWLAHHQGIVWQRGFFDHRLRNENSAIQKRGYILQNPVRAGLVTKASDWKYVYTAEV